MLLFVKSKRLNFNAWKQLSESLNVILFSKSRIQKSTSQNQYPVVSSGKRSCAKWNNGICSQALQLSSICVFPCTCLGTSSHRRPVITPSNPFPRHSHSFQKPIHYPLRRLSDGRAASLFHRLALARASSSMATHASQPLRHLHCEVMAAHHLFDLWRLPLLCYGILLFFILVF